MSSHNFCNIIFAIKVAYDHILLIRPTDISHFKTKSNIKIRKDAKLIPVK